MGNTWRSGLRYMTLREAVCFVLQWTWESAFIVQTIPYVVLHLELCVLDRRLSVTSCEYVIRFVCSPCITSNVTKPSQSKRETPPHAVTQCRDAVGCDEHLRDSRREQIVAKQSPPELQLHNDEMTLWGWRSDDCSTSWFLDASLGDQQNQGKMGQLPPVFGKKCSDRLALNCQSEPFLRLNAPTYN